MTPEHERWAEALAIEKRYGDEASIFVAERIGALATDGDSASVERSMQIAERLDKLRARPPTEKAD